MKYFRLAAFFLTMFVAAGMYACNDDNDNKIENSLEGEWKRQSHAGWYYEGEELVNKIYYDYKPGDEDWEDYNVVFHGNGDGYSYETGFDDDRDTFTWSVDNSDLRIKYGISDLRYEILELTSNTLIIEREEERSYERSSYVRIN